MAGAPALAVSARGAAPGRPADGLAAICAAKRAAEARAAMPISGAGALGGGIVASSGGATPCSLKRCFEARALAPSRGAGGRARSAASLADGAGGAV